MKRFTPSHLIVAGLVSMSTAAMADFSPEQMLEVTKLAIDDFKVAQREHVPHFYGYKAWKSADDVKVKIYVLHDGMTMDFNYLCHEHETGLECHAQ